MDSRMLTCFQACYETGSINKAASQLYLSPQGTGKILDRLEKEIGTALFERNAKGLIPTRSGQRLYERCDDLLLEMQNLGNELQRLEETDREISVGFACGVIRAIQTDPSLQKRKKDLLLNPAVRWNEGYNREIREMLLNGTISTAYTIGPFSSALVEEHEIYSRRLSAIVYPGHPLYDRKSITMEDLVNEDLITLNPKFSSYHLMMRRAQELGFIPRIIIETMESSLIYSFVKDQRGIGIDVALHETEYESSGIRSIEISDSRPWTIFESRIRK